MMNMNPFEVLDQRLISIERILSLMQTNQSAPTPKNDESLLEALEVAKIIKTPVTTVYRKAQKIGYIKHGKRLLFKRSDVMAYLEKYAHKSLSDRKIQALEALKERVKVA
jgi:excisionase family DNA binding protein